MSRGVLTENCKIVPILSHLTAAANADRSSEVIDCKGCEKVAIVLHLGVVNDSATQRSYLRHADLVTNETTLGADSAIIEASGKAHAGTDDDKVIVYEVRPKKRYLQLVIDKDAVNAGNESAIAYLYHGDERPVTQSLGTSAVGEGTKTVTVIRLDEPVTGTP